MRIKGCALLAMLVCVASGLIAVPSALADAGPFSCTTALDFISPSDQLYALQDTNSGPPAGMQALGSSPFGYNGIAFNQANGYLYAIASPPHQAELLRFDQAGTPTDFGAVSGLPTLYNGVPAQYVTGGFDGSGNLWVLSEQDATVAYEVNVAANQVIQTLHMSAPMLAYDWTWNYGYMWGFNLGILYQVNLSTGQVTTQNLRSFGGQELRGQFNAAWTFANSDLAFLAADPANPTPLVRITLQPGTWNVQSFGEFPMPGASSGVNDGSSCQPPDQAITLAGTPVNAVEGSSFTGQVASFTDPDGSSQASDYSAFILWGDGHSSAGTVSGPAGGPFTVSGTNTYAEEGPYTITVYVTDVDNASNQANTTTTASVADAALHSSCATPATSSQSFSGNTATFTDDDPNGQTSDYAATIDWGDGSGTTSGTVSNGTGSGPYTVSGSHTYSGTGYFTITTTIKDAGGSQTSTQQCKTLIYASPGAGSFVIGNLNSANGTPVTFWGAQWWKLNSLTGGTAPAAFKGFALNPSTPACGVNWSTDPGNSAPPPSGPLPAYMAVIVSSTITKSGSQISGDTQHIVVVQTNAGYQPNPGHAGTGTVVAQVC